MLNKLCKIRGFSHLILNFGEILSIVLIKSQALRVSSFIHHLAKKNGAFSFYECEPLAKALQKKNNTKLFSKRNSLCIRWFDIWNNLITCVISVKFIVHALLSVVFFSFVFVLSKTQTSYYF